MKWFTKRPQLSSNDKMYPALSQVLVGFVDKLKSEGKVKLWYTSLKNDDGRPSFRVYLQVEENDEQSLQSEFQTFMETNKAELGWTGQFIQPDPEPPSTYPRLRELNKACELILKLTKHFPQLDRKNDPKFWSEIIAEVNRGIGSVAREYLPEFIHFIANNLFITDDSFLKVLKSV